MCVVSMVSDDYIRRWDKYDWPKSPRPLKNNEIVITIEDWLEFQRLKKMAEEIDKKTNQPDCIDPDKDHMIKKIEEALRKHGLIK